MSSWSRRPSDADVASVVAAARSGGWLQSDDTAVVLHDLDLLDQRLDELRSAFPTGALHAIAIKANPLVEILRRIVAAGCGLEAASFEEVEIARAAGCPADRIVYDSPAKTIDELRTALALGVRVNADNFEELDRIIAARPEGSRSVVGLRVNPLVGDGSIPITSVAGARSRFGERIDTVVDGLVRRAEAHPWIRGLHHHVGSQGVSLDAHAAAAAAMGALRDELHSRLGRPQFDTIDIGGGATTDYVGEGAVSPAEFFAAVAAAAPTLFAPDTTIVTEFGAVLANTAVVVSRVEYVKELPSGPVAVLHVGADLLLRPAYQPEHWRHRFSVLPSTPATRSRTGRSCRHGPGRSAGPSASPALGSGATSSWARPEPATTW
ncbi:MAG: diaminopimelate decarboxylase [Acidimicrobiales bacterium]